jgi:EAL domain-containing protein (putative c-di-GMP-specific phosphodiesterase class I)
VELTEQAAVRNLDQTRSILEELKKLNVSVSLDDFGTGYSSFKSLIELPIDNLKIDKSFVLKVGEDPKNKRVVETARDIAETLDLEVIAEGVETENHVEYLRELGIDIMQGFYWTEPLSKMIFLGNN